MYKAQLYTSHSGYDSWSFASACTDHGSARCYRVRELRAADRLARMCQKADVHLERNLRAATSCLKTSTFAQIRGGDVERS